MTFAILILASTIRKEEIVVPPRAKFQVGGSIKRHGTLTAVTCQNNQKMTGNFTLTATRKSAADTVLTMAAADQPSPTTYALITNARGLPLSCRATAGDDDGQGITYLLMYMRQPLWPTTKRASSWTVSLPNPLTDKPSMMKVECKVARVKPGTFLLVEKTAALPIKEGASMQVTSKLEVNAKTGVVSVVHEDLNVLNGGTKLQVVTYDEHK